MPRLYKSPARGVEKADRYPLSPCVNTNIIMKFALSAFVALAIAVAAPTYAAVVSGGASGTVASAAAEQTITRLEGAQNSTARSAGPVSHCKSTLHHSAPPQGMRYLVQNFCDVNAGKPLRSGEPGPNTLEYTPASVGLGVTGNVPVRLGIGAGIDCATVIERDHCKAEMVGIINACGGHGGSIYHPNQCEYFAVYPDY
ncbi:hypothetical protein DFH06DRAFT_1335588 [Mycena polygramma]|nr:hypothetical protein DFH06DRAFT_1335588 [Mycena polygramma]